MNPISGQTKRLENMDTSGLTFPLLGSITDTDVERYFDKAYLDAGYTRSNNVVGALLSMNCHGYSTGMSCWLNDMSTKLAYDYTPETIAEHLGKVDTVSNNIVFATGGHSVRATTTAREVNGETEYEIVRTREKFNASAIYLKEINVTYAKTDNVSVGMTANVDNAVHTSTTVGYYYYPK